MPQDQCIQSSGGLGDRAASVGCAAAGSNGYVVGNVTAHGGPVMHSVTNYAIFWLPPGFQFDTPSIDLQYANASDKNYEALVGQYFRDLSDTAYYSIIQQYADASGAPGIGATFGGSWIDASQYPNSEGIRSNPLQDSDVQAEVTKAMTANGWSAGSGNNEFFVFTGEDVYSCAGNECSYGDYCSYHSYFEAADGQNVVYASIPDPGNVDAGTCLATAASGSDAPNGGAFADSAINLVAHEGFETATDPILNGWYYQDIGHEIADECDWKFGSLTEGGGDTVLNGHTYLVQEMWSNKAGGCYIPPSVSRLAVAASYQVQGGGSGLTPPTLTYYSGGVLENISLSTSPQTLDVDFGTVWNVTGTLAGSTSTERWETGHEAGGVVNLEGTFEFTYYHQYLVPVSYAGGGAGFSPPTLAYSSLGIAHDASLGQQPQSFWIDAGAQYSSTNPLQGSTATERWFAPGSSGTVSSASSLLVVYHQQYRLSVSGGFAVEASPQSPTGDGFYDAGSSVSISSARTWNATSLTREALVSYNLDGGTAQTVATPANDSGDFIAPSITVDGPHQLAFGSATQYLVGFRFTDALGLRTIIPTTFQIGASQPNATLEVRGSEAWLDAGSTFMIKQLLWEGVDVKPLDQIVSVDSPQNVTVAARVYDATLRVTDYLQIPISGASANIQLANGTTMTMVTGADGTISLTSIPLGRFSATVSYLGFSQQTSASSTAVDERIDVRLPASLPDIGATTGGVALVALTAYALVRRRRQSKAERAQSLAHSSNLVTDAFSRLSWETRTPTSLTGFFFASNSFRRLRASCLRASSLSVKPVRVVSRVNVWNPLKRILTPTALNLRLSSLTLPASSRASTASWA
jgi:Phosphate-induced protein 1 conserved region